MFVPQNEQGVVVLFSTMAQEAGWEFVSIGTTFPDAVLRKNGDIWRVEFEFKASNFLEHKHDHRQCDMIVCWENDYLDCSLPIVSLIDPDGLRKIYQKPSEGDKEIEYWKHRAMLAEHRLKGVSRQIREIKARTRGSGLTDELNEMLDVHRDNPKAQRARQLKSEGLSNVQIADTLGVHRNTVSAWLNGHSKAVQP